MGDSREAGQVSYDEVAIVARLDDERLLVLDFLSVGPSQTEVCGWPGLREDGRGDGAG